MHVFNSLTKKTEVFIPFQPPTVGMYTCGPTVYHHATIGNFRTYTIADLFRRALEADGFQVKYIMNITDVGHLTGDNLGDASVGQDRLEIAAAREAKSAWDIANFYANEFRKDYQMLLLLPPSKWVRATDHIPEQIGLIVDLEKKGFAYRISDGIYFDTAKCPEYGKLSTLRVVREGARVEINREKKNARDFALWKFSPTDTQREMEWNSPWGKGFPGWHIECSAMSTKYLGEQFDVHFGGEDLRSTHHPNEIAQSEAATGKKPFVKYWLHVAFLTVDKQKMSKSLGNAYTLQDIVNRGLNPITLKYFYYSGHYRTKINFTWEALEGASKALKKLGDFVATFGSEGVVNEMWWRKFKLAIGNDLNTPVALSVIWNLVKTQEISNADKVTTLLACDRVLGLGLNEIYDGIGKIPDEILCLTTQRDEARKVGDWKLSDILRERIAEKGYQVKDTKTGSKLFRL